MLWLCMLNVFFPNRGLLATLYSHDVLPELQVSVSFLRLNYLKYVIQLLMQMYDI